VSTQNKILVTAGSSPPQKLPKSRLNSPQSLKMKNDCKTDALFSCWDISATGDDFVIEKIHKGGVCVPESRHSFRMSMITQEQKKKGVGEEVEDRLLEI
jgi:hypothetical protein